MDDDSLAEVALAECREKMVKAVSHARSEFAGVRTGRPAPVLVEKLRIDCYGGEAPLQQLAGVTVPEGRLLVITPYDKGLIKAIEKAILQSDLGINPSNDGQVIRLVFPALTEERRRELVKVVRHKAEEARVAVRNLRRAGRHDLEGWDRDGDISSDELERGEKDLEKLTHDHVNEIDKLLTHKEQELLDI
ncbi:MAG: ribosome recycling factor [Acidimicrobiales bacterium]|nr:MAG: ribosome recycling factor [Acidimicrobiales bacterium]